MVPAHLLVFVCLCLATAVSAQVRLEAVLADPPGRDDAEFILIAGPPGAPLEGLALVAVEGDAGRGQGRVDWRFRFRPYHRIGPDGRFLLGPCEGLERRFGAAPDQAIGKNTLENSSLTLALIPVEALEADDPLAARAVDAVALLDGPSDRAYFDAPRVGPPWPKGARRTDGGWRPAPDLRPAGGSGAGCRPRPAAIPAIQGRGPRSPYEGERVLTEGVVTAVMRGKRQVWIQDPEGDGDRWTSDGLIVRDARGWPFQPRPGDRVRLVGRIQEYARGRELPQTQLVDLERAERLAGDRPLPEAVPLRRLPHVFLSAAIRRWEAMEGMRVRLGAAVVVGPSDRYGTVTVVHRKRLARCPAPVDPDACSGLVMEPRLGPHLLVRPYPGGRVDYNPERIFLDDDLARLPDLRPGDVVGEITGVVGYAYGAYRLYVQNANPRVAPLPEAPVDPLPPRRPEWLRLATFNLKNLFDERDDPGKADERSTLGPRQLKRKLDKLARVIAGELQGPDVVLVQELENEPVGQRLAARVSELTGRSYHLRSLDAGDRRGIEVGLLWATERLTLEDLFLLEARHTGGVAVPGRAPLVARLRLDDGARLTVVGVHFSSRLGDDPLYGVRQPPQRPSDARRRAQARAVRAFVERVLENDPGAALVVAGDFNDLPFPEPGEGVDPVNLVAGTTPPRLENLVQRLPAPRRYTFIYRGNAQAIDHILVSPSLRPCVVGVFVAHVNADYPERLARRPATPLRASDHDPLAIDLARTCLPR